MAKHLLLSVKLHFFATRALSLKERRSFLKIAFDLCLEMKLADASKREKINKTKPEEQLQLNKKKQENILVDV